MTQPTCKTCRSWETISDGYGICRRHAPQPYLTHENEPENDVRQAWWPKTEEHEFCGEFQE